MCEGFVSEVSCLIYEMDSSTTKIHDQIQESKIRCEYCEQTKEWNLAHNSL